MAHRNPAKHGSTPLARWLAATGKKQSHFIAECLDQSGMVLRPQVVSRWVLGQALPNQHSRALIARVSKGAIPPDAWFPKKKRAA